MDKGKKICIICKIRPGINYDGRDICCCCWPKEAKKKGGNEK